MKQKHNVTVEGLDIEFSTGTLAGLASGAVSDFSSYDPQSDSWNTDLPALPQPSDHAMGASVGDTLYAIGGRSGDIDSVRSSVYAFSVSDPVWRERAPMPTARGGAAAQCGRQSAHLRLCFQL